MKLDLESYITYKDELLVAYMITKMSVLLENIDLFLHWQVGMKVELMFGIFV